MREIVGKWKQAIYVKLKFEKIWGRKIKRESEGWGERIKGHRTIYTPAYYAFGRARIFRGNFNNTNNFLDNPK